MTSRYPIVFETEAGGTVSAYVPGLPVYAAADDHRTAQRAIAAVLSAYLEAHPDAMPLVELRVACVSRSPVNQRSSLRLAGVGAMLGARKTRAKARASRENGKKGGRPRLARR